MLAAVFVFESASEQAASRVGDNDGVRLGQCLEARGKVRRFADDRFFARGAATDDVADNDQSRRDADAGLQAGRPSGRAIRPTASTMASAARTELSAESSCACG